MLRRVDRKLVALLIVASLFLLTGCSDFVDQDQLRRLTEASMALGPGHAVGQTFVARHAGLNGVEVWLEPGKDVQGEICFHLRADPWSIDDLATARLSLAQVVAPGFYRFTFAPLPRSHGRYTYAFLELQGEGVVQVGAGPGDAYLDGALYRDGQPLDAQMAFRLVYDPKRVVLDLLQAAVGGLGLLGLAGLLYAVPGWALLAWLWPEGQLSWAEKLGVAAGLSLALYPLLFLWTDLVGLHLGSLYAWLPIVVGLAALVCRYRSWRPRRVWESLRRWARSEALWPDLALVGVMGLVFAVRLLVIRGLTVPSLGDSVQHAVMTQLMVDNGGLFDSWLPYAPYQSLTVHFGFSAISAVLQWVTGLTAVRTTLLAGQIVNGIAVLALYPLAVQIGEGNRWVGVGTVMITGLMSPMPAFYVNWGRYAQLAGQAVLPVALWLLWRSTRVSKNNWQTVQGLFLAGGALAGMGLCYYRMPFFYAAFALVWLLLYILPDFRLDTRGWVVLVARMALVGFVAGVFILPWMPNIAGGRLAANLARGVTIVTPLESVLAEYRIWGGLEAYVPWALVGLSVVAVAWATIRRQWTAVLPALWALLLVSLPAGRLVRLPGSNYMQFYAVLIALYAPVGLLAGWLVGQVAVLLCRGRRERSGLVLAVLLLAAGWEGRSQITIVQPFFRLVFPADEMAMRWIRDNTSPDARFLVNGYTIYNGASSVGSDAGWWLPLLARRENTMPPQYALFNEQPLTSGYTQAITQLVRDLQSVSITSFEGLQLLCQWGITHVYIGQGQGSVGYDAVPLLSVEALMMSSSFDLIYQQDMVRVFALDQRVCENASVRLVTSPTRGGRD